MLSGKRVHTFGEKVTCFPGRVSMPKSGNVSRPTFINVKCPTFGIDKYCNINQLSVFCPTFRDMGRWDNVGHLHVLIPENLRI